MGCCGHSKETAPFPRNLESGQPINRGCTDRCCLFIFILFLVGMVAEVFWAVSQGVDPRRLTHGVDYSGRICGVDVNESWVYWCGSAQRSGLYPTHIMHDSTICVSACPQDSSFEIPCLMPASHNVTAYNTGIMQLPGGPVPVKSALMVVVTQSISYQLSYPTEPFAGKFCMPARSPTSTLRDEIINGPYAWRYRAGAAFGTLRRAAPLLLGIALLTVILGYLYLLVLGRCAGLLIFSVMLLSVLLLFFCGLFFLWAMFVSGEDEHSTYQLMNPIFRTYIGWEAKWSSIVTGLTLIAASACLGFVTCKSYDHIDEAVGVVATACECLQQEGSLWFLPLVQAAVFIVLTVVVLIIGLPWVAALGHLDMSDISINGSQIGGLYYVFRRSFMDKLLVGYYVFGCWWMAEFFVSFNQFVVSYAVCLWYFQETEEVENPLPREIREGFFQQPVTRVKVRVAGVDDYYLPREGIIARVGKKKLLLAAVDDEMSLGIDGIIDNASYRKQAVPCAVLKGACVGFWNHMGSMALGSLLIAVCRPFRMFSNCLSGFVRQQKGVTDDGEDEDEDESPTLQQFVRGSVSNIDAFLVLFTYLGACADSIFGGYSSCVYSEMVLSASDFNKAAVVNAEFMGETGGSVAYLHGACFVYEVFGILCITLVNIVTFVICATKMDTFSNPSSDWYIPNLFWGTFFAATISALIAFEFMQVFNHTANVLLYAFAWNRRLSASDPEFAPEKYCPGALRDMMQDYELQAGGMPKLEGGEYTSLDYIWRAGLDHLAVHRNALTQAASKSASVASSRVPSSRKHLHGSSSSGGSSPSRLSKISEGPLMGVGNESARELSFR